MNRSARWIAAFLLMLLLPVQGLAAACAQICAHSKGAERVAVMLDAGGTHHCHDSGGSDDGAPVADGKCCHAHTFMEPPVVGAVVAPPSFQPLRFVARWTSFIPEEPSPPPIASAS